MGKLSGRHAFRQRLEELGYNLSDEEVNHAFERFKKLADQKKEIYEEDLEVIVSEELVENGRSDHFEVIPCVQRDGSGADRHSRAGDRWANDCADRDRRWAGGCGVSDDCHHDADEEHACSCMS